MHPPCCQPDAPRPLRLLISAMDCPVEVNQIRRALADNPHVLDMQFDTQSRTAVFAFTGNDADRDDVLSVLRRLGMPADILPEETVRPTVFVIENMRTPEDIERVRALAAQNGSVKLEPQRLEATLEPSRTLALLDRLQAAGWQARIVPTESRVAPAARIPYLRLGVAFAAAASAEALELAQATPEWVVMACAFTAVALAGLDTIRRGLIALMHANFTMTTLMAVAVIGAMLLGAWPEAAMVMVLYEIGETIESICVGRARGAIRRLLDTSPETAQVRVNERWQTVPARMVPVGTLFRIEPGERAALDGVVVNGHGAVDESMLTGESIPTDKAPGETIWAGTLSVDSAFVVRSVASADDSMSARILHAVEQAEQNKAPLQRFIDVFAARYTPTVFALSLATAVLGPLLTDLAWTEWLYRALVLLVIACPCALVISTPVTIVSALALAARHGILIKGGVYLEQGRLLKGIALDKTGTVTSGTPAVESVALLQPIERERALSLAATLARQSSHPVSRALARYADAHRVASLPCEGFTALPGYGTRAKIVGAEFRLTNLAWLQTQGPVAPEVVRAFADAHDLGQTAVALSDRFGVVAVFAVADTLKANARSAIESMRALGLEPHLLTGDNQRAATHIARAVGIDSVHAQLLPQDKLEVLEKLQHAGPCAMAGDGINDALALTRAPIGFAMGTKGADVAVEAADVALMDDDIGKIAWFKCLSEVTHATLVANIVFALSVKLGFALAALFGQASMWMAVFADTGVCLIVVAYGMRLLRADRTIARRLAARNQKRTV